MYNDGNPDELGQARGGRHAPVSVWNATVRAVIADYRQEAILVETIEQRLDQLTAAGGREEFARPVAEFIS